MKLAAQTGKRLAQCRCLLVVSAQLHVELPPPPGHIASVLSSSPLPSLFPAVPFLRLPFARWPCRPFPTHHVFFSRRADAPATLEHPPSQKGPPRSPSYRHPRPEPCHRSCPRRQLGGVYFILCKLGLRQPSSLRRAEEASRHEKHEAAFSCASLCAVEPVEQLAGSLVFRRGASTLGGLLSIRHSSG